jgi:hypothetical protein
VLPRLQKRGKHGKKDIPDFDDDYKGPQDTHPKQPMQSETTFCQSGYLCQLAFVPVIVKGKGYNGDVHCRCDQTFHIVCLYLFAGARYCCSCYKLYIVSQCSTEKLLQDLLSQQDNSESAAGRGKTHHATDLAKFVDKFLKKTNNT